MYRALPNRRVPAEERIQSADGLGKVGEHVDGYVPGYQCSICGLRALLKSSPLPVGTRPNKMKCYLLEIPTYTVWFYYYFTYYSPNLGM
jgi:hypothetical protein